MSLWSMSVPDEAVEQQLGQGTDIVCATADVMVRLSSSSEGKYTVIDGENAWSMHNVTLADIMATRPKTGVEFWTRALERIQELRTGKVRTEFEKDTSKRVQEPFNMNPTFQWDGDDLILQANKLDHYDDRVMGIPWFITYKIAQAFGFAKQDPVTQAWSLGPNATPSYAVYDQMPLTMADFTTYKPEGPTVFLPGKWNRRYNKQWEWYRFLNTSVGFSTGLEWRFTNLNRSFERLINQLETVMVYTDAVQSNTVNHRQVPLLRSVHLHRSGRGRVTVEPKHREWIPLNGNTLDLLEFQLATASGPLTDLSPGQTIVTVGLKPIKS